LLERGNLWVAEALVRELHQVSLEDAIELVPLYADKESPKYERAAMKWLRRYLDERSPALKNFAAATERLAQTRRTRASEIRIVLVRSQAMASTFQEPQSRLLTVAEVADRLGVSVWTAYRKVEAGEIPSVRLGQAVADPR
jgi:excisionase family DNA binding protein